MKKKADTRARRLRQAQRFELQAKDKELKITNLIKKNASALSSRHQRMICWSAMEILENEPLLPIKDAAIRGYELAKKKLAIEKTKSNSKDIPEYIKLNILRVEKAETERKKRGDSLPQRYTVSGGGVSPK